MKHDLEALLKRLLDASTEIAPDDGDVKVLCGVAVEYPTPIGRYHQTLLGCDFAPGAMVSAAIRLLKTAHDNYGGEAAKALTPVIQQLESLTVPPGSERAN